MTALTVIGDTLLDQDIDGDVARIAADAPVPVLQERSTAVRPGGAGLAATLAAGDGHEVRLVTALSDDDGGHLLRRLLVDRGVEVIDLVLGGPTPTKTRIRSSGQVLLRLDKGDAPGQVLAADRLPALSAAEGVLVSDYGNGLGAQTGVRQAIEAAAARGTPVVWDPHPRGCAPVPGLALATPNVSEAAGLAGVRCDDAPGCIAAAKSLRAAWAADWVCVTRGDQGLVAAGSGSLALAVAPSERATGDPCGAGDRLAGSALAALAGGATVPEALEEAVSAASAFVASAEAVPAVAVTAKAEDVVAATRRRGGVVVAAGGCFDILHPGHVRLLKAARALGDCLVVCLNSDSSVSAIKGPSRPINGQRERAELLAALGCVDAIAIFGEPTPARILSELRPDIWVKGEDHGRGPLPESPVLEAIGAQTVLLPRHGDYSTTRIIEEANHAA